MQSHSASLWRLRDQSTDVLALSAPPLLHCSTVLLPAGQVESEGTPPDPRTRQTQSLPSHGLLFIREVRLDPKDETDIPLQP